MMKRSGGLSFKFGMVFGVFLLVAVLICGITTYFSQMTIYHSQCEKNITNIAAYLADLIKADGEDFLLYKKYYLENFTTTDIRMDADEYVSYQIAYEDALAKHHPGKALGVDLTFDELDDEVKKAWFVYTHLYWILTFEKARADYNLPYTYFLIPDSSTRNVHYMIDAFRASRAYHIKFLEENPEYKEFEYPQGDEEEYMYLGDTYHNDLDYNPILWKTWETGEIQDGFMVWHNQWGDNYSCYVPVIINGEKVGLVVTEIDIADVNSEIMKNTLTQVGLIAGVLLVCLMAALIYINRQFISKIVRLEAGVHDYTSTKNAEIVASIEKNVNGQDEIVTLSDEIISMIIEIENYIKSLMQINEALAKEKGNSARLSDLAHKDALTGVRNRSAYEKEMQRLEWGLADGETEFAIAVIDLNFLKRINDTYGHEQGNYAIKKLCHIVCHVFEHSPVFRTGGDEFVAVLKNDDFKNRDKLVEEFNSQLEMLKMDESLEPWEQISAAIGVAVYDKEYDSSVDNVFKRTEEIMYARKKDMKAVRV